jgi:hypothetical protein
MGRQVTITLDDDVAERLAEARREGVPVERAVNDAVRRALEPHPPRLTSPFTVEARDLGARRGVNFDCAWKLLAELETADRDA